MTKRQFNGLILNLYVLFMTIFLDVDGLTKPTFISTWQLMDSTDPGTTQATINHGLGMLPAMVEVQIRSNTTGFIYPGVKSAFVSNTNTPRGGVVYNYDETSVYLYGATDHGGEPAYIIFTGSISWTTHSQETSKIGWVRVRAWAPANLPDPSSIDIGYTASFNIAAERSGSGYPINHEIAHNFGIYPVLTVVQYTPSNVTHPLYGRYAEGQGSSSRPVDDVDSVWGGLIHAVNETHMRLWAPDHMSGYLYSFCGSWGGSQTTDCSFDEARVEVKIWKTVQAPLTFNYTTTNHQQSFFYSRHHYTTFPLFLFNADTDIIVGLVLATDGANSGFEFPGAGAAMMDDGPGAGGLIFGYYEYMYEIRYYHPAAIIYMNGLANGWNQQESYGGDIRLRLMMVNWLPVDFCLEQFMPDNPGVNTTGNETFVSSSPGCLVTYQCIPGYELHSGSLLLFYNQQTKAWNGSAPTCQEASTTSTIATTTTTLPTTTSTIATTTTTLPTTTSTIATTTTTLAPTTSTTTDVTSTTTDVTSTTTDVTTTQSASTTVSSDNQACYCFNYTNYSMSVVMDIAEEFVVNFTIHPKNTSRYARSLISSDDYRFSAKLIGIIGSIVCAIVGLLIVLSDIASVWQPKTKTKANGNGKKPHPKNA